MFDEYKISQFQSLIEKLADRPQMSAQALKEYFDDSSEELRVAHNSLIDALNTFSAGSIANVAYSAADGKLTFTLGGGSSKVIDLPLELLIQSGTYDSETQSIVLTLANGDALNIYVGDLIDTYAADGATLVLNGSTFSVKDGVFVKEAPADGKAYARKDASWAEVLDSLPEITIEQADDAIEGVYKVVKVEHAHRYYGVLCAYADCYLYEYADVVLRQTILWSDGKIENRRREEYVMDADNVVQREDGTCIPKDGYTWYNAWSAWESVIPSLVGYATDADVADAIRAIPHAAHESGEYGLVKLGTPSKGIGLTEDGELILKETKTTGIDKYSTMLTITRQCHMPDVVARSTHQQMSDSYAVGDIALNQNSKIDGYEDKLPVSYAAVKAYIDAKFEELHSLIWARYEDLNARLLNLEYPQTQADTEA